MSQRPNFDELCAALRQLNLEQARQLYGQLGVIVQELEEQSTSLAPVRTKSREVVETRHMSVSGVFPQKTCLYQLERVRCGKAGCRCAGKEGDLHGPYWYAYWRDDGKLKSRYIGKQLRQIESGKNLTKNDL